MSCDNQFWIDRLNAAKAQLALYDDAISALVVQGVEEYMIDTGQSRQRVTKRDLVKLQGIVDSLENKIATLNARIYGCNQVTVRPCF